MRMMIKKSPNMQRGITRPRFTSLPPLGVSVVVDVVLYGVKAGFSQNGRSGIIYMQLFEMSKKIAVLNLIY